MNNYTLIFKNILAICALHYRRAFKGLRENGLNIHDHEHDLGTTQCERLKKRRYH